MRSTLVRAFALAAVVAIAAGAQKVTDSVHPLPDEDARVFAFIGDVGLAIQYDGGGKITAKVNAYRLGAPAPLWRQELRVRQDEASTGPLLVTDDKRGRLFFGNGPLTVLDAATGKTLWALDCRTAGAVDMGKPHFLESALLLIGTEDCGERNKLKIMKVDFTTGAIAWQASARVHEYKAGTQEHRDFEMRRTPNGRLVLIGERMQAVDVATGAPVWEVKQEIGRAVESPVSDLAFFARDDKLEARRMADGELLWKFDMRNPTAILSVADPAAPETSDLIVFTWHATHRLARATGKEVWTMKRDQDAWGQGNLGIVVLAAAGKGWWDGLDPATGARRWRAKIEGSNWREVEESFSPSKTGVVLFQGYESRGPIGPFVLTAIDATTGAVRWQAKKVNGDDITRFVVADSTRIIVMTGKNGAVSELDPKTGAVLVSASGTTAARNDGKLVYDPDTKRLTCVGANGAVLWSRSGEQAEKATVMANYGLVVWPQVGGKVELINIASGQTVGTITGNRRPAVGVDDAGHLLVPEGRQLHVVTITR